MTAPPTSRFPLANWRRHMKRRLPHVHHGEEGHGGAALTVLLAIAATIVLAVGLTGDGDALRVAGSVLMGLAIVVGSVAPHKWVKRLSARLDRMDPHDPDARPNTRTRMEF